MEQKSKELLKKISVRACWSTPDISNLSRSMLEYAWYFQPVQEHVRVSLHGYSCLLDALHVVVAPGGGGRGAMPPHLPQAPLLLGQEQADALSTGVNK